MNKKIEELIGLPSESALLTVLNQEEYQQYNLTYEIDRKIVAAKLALHLESNDTRRALIEAMLPVFVAAMKAHLAMLRRKDGVDGVEDLVAMSRAAQLALVEIDAETLKILGVT